MRFVRPTVRATWHADRVPVVMTCGRDEENLANKRAMAAALAAQGYDAALHELEGGHDWESWRCGFDHLAALVARVWAP